MKDSEGREYDGWCLRYPEDWGGRLAAYTFSTTRTDLWDNFIGALAEGQSRKARNAKYRHMGFRSVKVRIVEAE